jgi:hypothetical protein
MGYVALVTETDAKLAGESDCRGASEMLNQRMSRAVPLESLIDSKGMQTVAIVSGTGLIR